MFRVISIKLVGSKRLLNKGTNLIEYRPENKIQLIIGGNGFGKSTLMDQLSPLPAVPKDFIKGGSKEIVIESEGSIFRLVSDFTKGANHWFYKDDVNLNEGRTITLQRDLVKKYFNYDDIVHNLMMGKVKLTKMSTNERKAWLVKLSNVDMTYAMGLHKRLNTELRNITGAIQHNTNKLTTESDRILSEHELSILSTDLNKTTANIRNALERKDSEVNWSYKQDQRLIAIEEDLTALAHDVLDNHRRLDVGGFTNQELIESELIDVKNHLQSSMEKRGYLQKEYDGLKETLELIATDGDVSTESILKEIKDTEEESYTLKNKTPDEYLSITDASKRYDALTNIRGELSDLLMKLPVNKDFQQYNKDVFSSNEIKRRDVVQRIKRLEAFDSTTFNQIQHLESHTVKESCPSCSHSWIPGRDEEHIKLLKNRRENEIAPELKRMTDELAVMDQWFESANEWKAMYMRYISYSNTTPELSFLWDYFVDEHRIYNKPSSLVAHLWKVEEYLNNVATIQKNDSIISVNKAAIEQRSKTEGISSKSLKSRLESIDDQISQLLEKESDYKTQLERLNVIMSVVNEFNGYSERIKTMMDEMTELKTTELRHKTNMALESYINAQTKLLSNKTQMMNSNKTILDVVEHLEKSLQELNESYGHHKTLLDVLSPVNGLIAKSMVGLINCISEQMNTVLRRVWSTSITILPCKMKNSDLDYKFPVLTEESGESVPDVVNGSVGEQEIIDLAFTLVARTYLGMMGFPLCMDEVGIHFTEAHRMSLFDYIKDLINQEVVSQIFIISHFNTTHGAIPDAEVNILDTTGILVKPEYNKNFTIQ